MPTGVVGLERIVGEYVAIRARDDARRLAMDANPLARRMYEQLDDYAMHGGAGGGGGGGGAASGGRRREQLHATQSERDAAKAAAALSQQRATRAKARAQAVRLELNGTVVV